MNAHQTSTTPTGLDYIGSELELFSHAKNWKGYFSSKVKKYVKGHVLEVGAGLGSNTELLFNSAVNSWECLEPDAQMAATLAAKRQTGKLPPACTITQGILSDKAATDAFDTILYIDVLEHILDDRHEVREAASRLKRGGTLVVLSPAHQALYSPFDKAIGHHRRYSIPQLRALAGAELTLQTAFYLDSVGSAASLANVAFLKSSQPTITQIKFWDSVLVSASRVVDPLTFFRLGKTVIAVWQRT